MVPWGAVRARILSHRNVVQTTRVARRCHSAWAASCFLVMYLRKHKREKNGACYEYWTLVETVRTARGPRQRIVGNLGKLPGLDEEERVGWEEIGRILSGRPRERQPGLFGSVPEPPDWATVDLGRVKAERLRRFGDVYLALAIWRRLGLDILLREVMPVDGAEIEWDVLACLLVVARFCEPSSELAIAERFYGSTALDDLLGIPPEKVNEDRLYRALDAVLPHKDAICSHLLGRYADWFGTPVDFLLYDVTSTYFEGKAEGNRLAARGYSRDHRPDCPQVCIGLVVTPEGLPVGYEVFAGNRADVTTLDDMIELLEQLERIKKTPEIIGIQILWQNPSLSFAQAYELRKALVKTDKEITIYAKNLSNLDYYVCSCADWLGMTHGGYLSLVGLGMDVKFFRRTLDKIGARMEVVSAGKYKDIGMFTDTTMNESVREEQEQMLIYLATSSPWFHVFDIVTILFS